MGEPVARSRTRGGRQRDQGRRTSPDEIKDVQRQTGGIKETKGVMRQDVVVATLLRSRASGFRSETDQNRPDSK
ncbi:hypothetical protein PUN4_370093 [Paraburkholderia unamae]|nr:hypothetical protein PUN4_370093 [Paraburkholderia unamae]